MRIAPLAVHNRALELWELRDAASAAVSKARGKRRRTAARAKLDAVQSEIDAIYAAAHTWPQSRSDVSYGVPTPCGKRVSHFMSLIDGAWTRHE